MRWGALTATLLLGCANATVAIDAAVRDLTPTEDATPPPDMGIAIDFSKVYLPTTIRQIDIGMVPPGTLVALTGVVMTSAVAVRAGAGNSCNYQAWVQDPQGPPPSGLNVFVPQIVANPCPAPDGPFAGRAQGDNVNVRGTVVGQTFSGDGGTVIIQHSIALDSLLSSGGSATITPLQLNDPTSFSAYGAGFQAYEGMLVSLGCTTGTACAADGNKLKVKYQPNPYLWGVTGGALFGSAFTAAWPGKPGITGTAYTRIVGVTNAFLTGSLEPRAAGDFIP